MAERVRPTFDQKAVAKALGAEASSLADPAYGAGWHFQLSVEKPPLSLDTFPEAGVSRITTKSARIELFGGRLPTVEDEGIVFLRSDSDHEHSSVALHPDGGVTVGYMVDTGPVAVSGLPAESEDTEQIITSHKAVSTSAEQPEPAVVTSAPKPPEKTAVRTPGAFPDERPMIQRGANGEPDPTTNGHLQPAPHMTDATREALSLEDQHPLDRAARIRVQDQQGQEASQKPRRTCRSGSSSPAGSVGPPPSGRQQAASS